MERFYWKAYCSKNRTRSITEIRNITSKHGFILDFKRFSDVSISLSIEIERHKISILYDELREYMRLEDFDKIHSDSKMECTILLNVTFTKSTGDMIMEAPAVPG